MHAHVARTVFFYFYFFVSKRISNVTQKGNGNNLVHKITRLLKKKNNQTVCKSVKSEQLQSIYATQVQYQMSCSDFYIKNNQTREKARQVNCGYNHDRMC